jgi:hypothetical protein
MLRRNQLIPYIKMSAPQWGKIRYPSKKRKENSATKEEGSH